MQGIQCDKHTRPFDCHGVQEHNHAQAHIKNATQNGLRSGLRLGLGGRKTDLGAEVRRRSSHRRRLLEQLGQALIPDRLPRALRVKHLLRLRAAQLQSE